MPPFLNEIEDDLLARRARADRKNWLGKGEGIDLTLQILRTKRIETQRLTRIALVDIDLPSFKNR
ncbi:recombinase [Saccharothrix xinjiangensis]|uniref:Recombinase n=1 Tax=Saccharothrix xinjiangensis TaxID=204798 RepID=A0ABV9XYL4_9PSEU